MSYNSQVWRQKGAGIFKLGRDVGYGFGWRVQAGSLTPLEVYGQLHAKCAQLSERNQGKRKRQQGAPHGQNQEQCGVVLSGKWKARAAMRQPGPDQAEKNGSGAKFETGLALGGVDCCALPGRAAAGGQAFAARRNAEVHARNLLRRRSAAEVEGG